MRTKIKEMRKGKRGVLLLPLGPLPPDLNFVCKNCLQAQPSLYRYIGLRPPDQAKP